MLNSLNLYLIRNKSGNKCVDELSSFSFFKIGLGQCLGLVPGFSRSGSSLGMCYREKMNKEDSQTFTFLMLFPLVVGAVILNIGDRSLNAREILQLFDILNDANMFYLTKVVCKNKSKDKMIIYRGNFRGGQIRFFENSALVIISFSDMAV